MNYVTPVGFRDVMSEEALVREDLISRVRQCFAAKGYRPVETPTLEVLDVMEAGSHVPEAPFKFFDSHGDLLAMRPDVTMQIARMCATRLDAQSACHNPLRFRYTQRVFREKTAEAAARELTQCGVECIGATGTETDVELVELFATALVECGLEHFTIALGSAGVLRDVLAKTGTADAWQNAVLQAYHTSNFVDLSELVAQAEAEAAASSDAPVAIASEAAISSAASAVGGVAAQAGSINREAVRAIFELPRLRGGKSALTKVRALVEPLGCASAIDELEAVYDALVASGLEDKLLIDFSVMSSFDYYTGLVFEAYAPGLGSPLGGGGRYDNLLASYGAATVPAAGFAFYLEQVMVAYSVEREERPLRIAVPKGSLNADAIATLEAAGLDVDGLADAGRTLMLRNGDVEYLIVRPTDAPVFVALGAADCGICGEDSLLEASPDVVELVDLKFGGCRFVVAESAGTTEAVERRYRKLGSIRVATKYPHITRSYFGKIGMQVEIVKLHGNIELAPITGMAERIVDITATGTTLRENNLVIVDDVLASTARFFANPCSFRTNPRVGALADVLYAQAKEN